ncbi:GAF domain-containing protein [Acidovorax sp. SUPP2522]|uniref:GAF domain-containing protein n=1 Tax=unclassified Acidovorax TaxID=2684926 RepID=UPI00234B79B0|nr:MULTISPECIES: GAF domain-containing protein [unclassified Acidovorax]WCM98383.1 GAF domain-containing protein [Acidovorax sp. GBBC 1281]GKT14161.1 GAF domain-containing protein [Acidovorax sp. SUPP2522]
MTPARPPENEAQRLRALQALMLLDTPPEERFDRFVRFAAEQLDAPIALMSLIDGQRQWFKSRVGLDVPQTSRDMSFCAHAILQPDLFVVEDANLDARFADNPLVTQAPHIRFYAGAPLCAPTGERLGTLCIIDTKPRSLTATERAVLRALGTLANETIAGKDQDA